MPDANPTTDADIAADRLFAKLRTFAAELDPTERDLLAALLGPGVAAAFREEDEVAGFAMTWEPRRLPDHLIDAIHRHQIRVVGLDPDAG